MRKDIVSRFDTAIYSGATKKIAEEKLRAKLRRIHGSKSSVILTSWGKMKGGRMYWFTGFVMR